MSAGYIGLAVSVIFLLATVTTIVALTNRKFAGHAAAGQQEHAAPAQPTAAPAGQTTTPATQTTQPAPAAHPPAGH